MALARAASTWAYTHLGGGRKEGWKCGGGGRACARLEVRPAAPIEDDGTPSPPLNADQVVGRPEQRNLVKGFSSLPSGSPFFMPIISFCFCLKKKRKKKTYLCCMCSRLMLHNL